MDMTRNLKILLVGMVMVWTCLARAANPAFSDFDLSQFNVTANKVHLKSGASLTNLAVIGTLTLNGSPVGGDAIWTNGIGYRAAERFFPSNIYGPGTITLTNGTNTVIGNGTAFLNEDPETIGDFFEAYVVDSNNDLYRIEVDTITDDTHLDFFQVLAEDGTDLGEVWPGVTGTYQYYIRVQSPVASGQYSLAAGKSSTASGRNSVAMGRSTVASGIGSTVFGDGSIASGNQSIAGGTVAISSGIGSVALGTAVEANGDYSVALSDYAKANGHFSFAFGSYPIANGYSSVAIGSYLYAAATNSFAIGNGGPIGTQTWLTNSIPDSLAVGFSTTDWTFFVRDGGVGVLTTNVNAAAALQVDSTAKGFLPPRMTQAQRDAISSPPDGLMIYQTDNTPGMYQRKSGAWTAM